MHNKPSTLTRFKAWLREEKYRHVIARELFDSETHDDANHLRAHALITQLLAGRPSSAKSPHIRDLLAKDLKDFPRSARNKGHLRIILEAAVVSVALAIAPVTLEGEIAAQ